MSEDKVYKENKSLRGRLLRMIGSMLNPRAFLHALKIVNYYNFTHVAEVRRIKRGAEVRISPTASFANGRNIELGDRVRIGANCTIWAGPGVGRIVIDKDVLIAPNVMMTAANYLFNEGSPVTDQAMAEADIYIGPDVWLGYGAVILPGARIGSHAIIGAGALVRSEVPAYSIVAAPQAVVIGQRQAPGDDA